MQMLFHVTPLVNPVPNAFATASFAAHLAAKWGNGSEKVSRLSSDESGGISKRGCNRRHWLSR